MNWKKIGFAILDGLTRTWTGFWCTIAFTLIYCGWNMYGHGFDPYPFMFLTMAITMLSYYQNIIIMTIQREDHEIQLQLEIKQAEQEAHEYEMIEDIFEEITHKDPPK